MLHILTTPHMVHYMKSVMGSLNYRRDYAAQCGIMNKMTDKDSQNQSLNPCLSIEPY